MANNKNTLVHRIAMEGADALEKELKSIGEEGEKAWAKIKAGAESVSAAGKGLNKFFLTVRQDLKSIADGAKDVSKGFDTIAREAQKFSRNIILVGAAVAGAAAAIFGLSKASADLVDQQFDAAKALGLTLQEYGRLRFAFEQSGASAEQFGTTMNRLNVRINEAAQGTGLGAELFRRYGIRVKDASGNVRSAEAIFADLSEVFKKLPEGAERSALAIQLFGRSGAAAVQVLSIGKEALTAFGAEAERLGLVLTDVEVQIGTKFNDAFDRTTRVVDALRLRLGLLFAPAFTDAMLRFSDFLADNQAKFLAIGQTLADKVLPYIQDFFAILAGDDAAVVNKGLLTLRDTVLGIGEALGNVAAVVGTVFDIIADAVQPVADLINTLFGTQLTGATLLLTVAVSSLLGVFRLFGATVKGVQLIFAGLSKIFGTTVGLIVNVGARILLLRSLLSNLFQDVMLTLSEWTANVAAMFQGLADNVVGFFTGMGEAITGIFSGIMSFLQNIINTAKEAIAAVARAFGGGGGESDGKSNKDARKFARGGMIRGPGTGTSDSIIARVSAGEYIVRAKAVRRLGLRTLNAINAGRLPGFAAGGLVARSVPSFAPASAGGDSNSKKAFDLVIGGEVFEGLLAPESVATKLHEFGIKRNTRRAGKAPGWR
jgi:hypothetical protein